MDRGYSFSSTAEREIVREMKEAVSYIALDYEQELASASPRIIDTKYQLPDGQTIVVGTERFRCPEALFSPRMLGVNGMGIAELLYEAVMKCDLDVRRDLWVNCLLAGGRKYFVCSRTQSKLFICRKLFILWYRWSIEKRADQ